MGTEIDRLDVKIEAEASDANKQLDETVARLKQILAPLNEIMGNMAFTQLKEQSKEVNKSMSRISSDTKAAMQNLSASVEKASKPMKETTKRVSESLEEIQNRYKDLGKDFQFFGSAESAQKQIEKYSNALETAKLKKAELESTGRTEGQMYEYAVRDIQKYSNMIDTLRKKTDGATEYQPQWGSQEEFDNWYNNLHSIKEQTESAAQSIKESFDHIDEPLKEIGMTLANFSMRATDLFSEPQEESNNFAKSLQKLKDTVYGIQESFLEFKGRLENIFASKGLKTYTSKYAELQNEISKTEKTLATLNAQMARSRETVKNFEKTTTYRKMQYDIEQARIELQRLRKEQDKLEVSGGATQWNFKGLSEGMQSFKKSLQPLSNTLKQLDKKITSFVKKLRSIVLPTKSAKKSVDGFSISNIGLAKSLLRTTKMLKLMVVRMALRGIIDSVKTGMQNLALYSDQVNASISLMMNSVNQLKNSFAAMTAPLLNAVTPALNYLIQLCVKAANAVNQLISALLGNDTWIRAKKLTQDYRDTIQGVKDDVEEVTKTILGFDQLNVLNGKNAKTSSGTADLLPGDMFETVPIESKFKDLAEKIKGILSKFFNPLKEAWSREGKFVMDSWKYALNEIWELIKSIGSDFLEVWQQEKTIKIFEDILHIIGDIGLVVGNLAHNFREAWEENETGKKILEGIRDIIGVIVANIRHAADATVEWSAKLDFSPLLTKIQAWIESLVPVFDNLSGIVTDFYEKVLLPLGKWTIEKGLPDLLQVFIDFNEKVDWEALRASLSEFWEHLEPFAETIGEGLILFIERVSNALADFINSEAFDNFLTSVENWMDNVDAEDVADALENIAKALIALKGAVIAFKGVSAAINVIDKLFKVIKGIYKFGKKIKDGLVLIGDGLKSLFGGLSGAAGLNNASNMLGIFSSFNPGMIGEIGIKLGDLLTGSFLDPREWDNWIGDLSNKISELANNFSDWIGQNVILPFFEDLGEIFNLDISMGFFNDAYEKFKEGGWHILEGLGEGLIGALCLIPELIKNLFETLWKDFCDLFGIHSPAESMKPLGEFILLGVIEGFKGKFEEFNSAINEWYENHVKPWFTQERWSELWENVKIAFSNKWQEIKDWWSNTAIVNWWNDNVSPWFTQEKWNGIFENIKSSLKNVWDNTVGQWSADISSWWSNDVSPWFTLKKWEDILSKIPEAFMNKFTKAKENALGAIEEMYNKIVGWVEDMISKIQGVIDKMKEAASAKSSSSSSSSSSGNGYRARSSGNYGISIPEIKIPKINVPKININIPKFATGGFPEDGLFMANHGELLGKFANGKTAVANNDQITTGIENAVYRAMMNVMQSGSFGNIGNIMVDAVLKTENDEVLARAVARGQKKLDRRYKPSID